MRLLFQFLSALSTLSILLVSTAAADETKLFAATPEQVALDIESDFDKAEQLCADNTVGAVREQISLIKFNIRRNQRFISPDKNTTYNSRIATLAAKAARKADSLVKVNLRIIREQGSTAGYRFRQDLSIKNGLFETELLPVDKALEERAGKDGTAHTPVEKPETSPPPEIAAPTSPPPRALTPEEAGDLDENERRKATALSTASKITGLLDAGNVDEASTVFNIHEQYLRRFLDESQFSDLKKTVDDASVLQGKERVKATAKAKAIERLLDQDQIPEAFAELQDGRGLLAGSLDPEALRHLEKKVGQAYSSYLKMQSSANRTMREIRDLLTKKRSDEAYGLFEVSRPSLERYLYPEAFKVLQKEVAAAYQTVQDKKKLSGRLQKDIHLLCDAGKVVDATNLLAGNENLLRQHLSQREYSALESDVREADRALKQKQTHAASDAASIESLLAAGRIQAAWSLFDSKKESLKKYLARKDRFPELRERVVSAYDELREAQSRARSISGRITSLCDRHEGKKAFTLFMQEAAFLQKYSAGGVYSRLESQATIASAAYDAKQVAARNTCIGISSLLSQKQTVQAHVAFKEAEDDISFYLGDDPSAETLRKKEAAAWATWQERVRWAASTTKQVRAHIAARRGNNACELLREKRPELQKYVDPQVLARLDADAAAAGSIYAREKSAADRNLSMVNVLVDNNRIEDAATAFDTLENDLRFYCAPAAFAALRDRVETADGRLKDKKSEARRIVAAINAEIAAKQGDSAMVLFTRNSALLTKYCEAAVYRKTAQRVEQADQDYKKNVREANALSVRLKAMAQRDRQEFAAYEQFREKRSFLSHYLHRGAFTSLETALRTPYDAFMERRKDARVLAGAIKRMLRDGQFTIAKFQFDQNSRQLARFLPGDEYKELEISVETSYTRSISGRKAANATAGRVRNLLGDGRYADAHAAFRTSRETLERYLPETEFSGLRTEVTSAWEEQQRRVSKAKEYARMLKQRVAKKQTWEAYRDFKLNRAELSEYLDAQTYTDLETTVVSAYEEHQAAAKKKR